MKNLITIFIMLVVVGCGKSEVENKRFEAELKEEQRKSDAAAKAMPKELTLEEKVVGEYEYKDENTIKQVYLENGIQEWHGNGKQIGESKWSIVDGEIHVIYGSGAINVYRINPDNSITPIAYTDNGKRTDYPKEDQVTWQKIK